MSVEIGFFSKIPSRFFGSGVAAEVGPSAALLFIALCEHANREGKNTFKASDKALASETTLSPRTISNGRKRLVERGLLLAEREPGNSYTYTTQKLTLDWVKLKDRPRQKRKPRGLHGSPVETSLANFAEVTGHLGFDIR
jgi:hypothetical protein